MALKTIKTTLVNFSIKHYTVTVLAVKSSPVCTPNDTTH